MQQYDERAFALDDNLESHAVRIDTSKIARGHRQFLSHRDPGSAIVSRAMGRVRCECRSRLRSVLFSRDAQRLLAPARKETFERNRRSSAAIQT
tara:strand:+ start:1708 stop:1989 length:282 start_codon:yes stop_codon:yes gene_type:complete